MTQRTDQWFRDRLGKVTASRFGDVMGSPAAWRSYASEIRQGIELRASIDNGDPVDLPPSFCNEAMAWGNTYEDVARAEYEMRFDVDVVVPDFIVHPTHSHIGCSADGLIFIEDSPLAVPVGGIEGKCPFNQNVHARTLVTREMPTEHRPQVQGVIWVCGLKWCDFTSFDPRRDDDGRLFVARQLRDETYIALLAERVGRFWQFVVSGDSDPGDFYAEQTRDIPQLF
jgi:predicted phage-related endonuclease